MEMLPTWQLHPFFYLARNKNRKKKIIIIIQEKTVSDTVMHCDKINLFIFKSSGFFSKGEGKEKNNFRGGNMHT